MPRFLALLLATVVAASGCLSHQMYRKQSVVEESGYTLAFIEFDDRGEIWSPRQFTALQELIRESNQHEEGAVVVLLAHGWNNNASPENEETGTLAGFKETLGWISQTAHEEDPDRPVVGIYLGWRGKSMVSPFTYLTFYSRQKAAARVAGTQGMTVLGQLISETKSNPKSNLIVIGHSFGGKIVERLVQQSVAAGIIVVEEGPVGPGPDLTVLLNPASPATNAKQVIDLLRWNRLDLERRGINGERWNAPLLVSLTSESDSIIRGAYRVGRQIGLATSKFRKYGPEFCSPVESQRRFYSRTAGHIPELHSHKVSVSPRAEGVRSFTSKADGFVVGAEDVDISVDRRRAAYNDTPYWIMRVPREVMADHNDTWNPNLIAMLGGLLEATGALDPGSELFVTRDDELDPMFILPWTEDSLWIVDRSRRVLDITEDREHGVLVGCVPPGVDLANIIGHTGDAKSFLIVQWRTDPGRQYRRITEIEEIVLSSGGFESTSRTVIDSDERFLRAAADQSTGTVYLATSERLYSVSVRDRRATPELLAELDLTGEPSALDVDSQRGRFFLLDEGAGLAMELDLAAPERGFETVVSGLGSGSTLAVHPTRGDLVVIDPASSRLMKYPRHADGLGPADVDPLPTALHEATFVQVSVDGSLWVGDLVSDAAFQFSADGELLKVLD